MGTSTFALASVRLGCDCKLPIASLSCLGTDPRVFFVVWYLFFVLDLSTNIYGPDALASISTLIMFIHRHCLITGIADPSIRRSASVA